MRSSQIVLTTGTWQDGYPPPDCLVRQYTPAHSNPAQWRWHSRPTRQRCLRRVAGAFHFSFDETLDIGKDTGTPVTEAYPVRGNAFTGTVAWVQFDIDAAAADQDHLLAP